MNPIYSYTKEDFSTDLSKDGAYLFIGAGASAPYKFTSGPELLDRIKGEITDPEFKRFVNTINCKSVDELIQRPAKRVHGGYPQ